MKLRLNKKPGNSTINKTSTHKNPLTENKYISEPTTGCQKAQTTKTRWHGTIFTNILA
jgi:hypothetical protein